MSHQNPDLAGQDYDPADFAMAVEAQGPRTLKDWALHYAALGYPVFPLAPMDKVPMTGSRGFLDATTDPGIIGGWWTTTPQANIGLATSGMQVVDIDPLSDDTQNPWPNDPAKLADIQRTPRTRTPRGGIHHFYKKPLGKLWRCTASRLANKVDTRTDGGYVVAPPSVRADGQYICEAALPLREELPAPPDWLVEDFDAIERERHQASRQPEGGNNLESDMIPTGARNDTLARIAGAMRRHGAGVETIYTALTAENQSRCELPLTDREVRGIARSVCRYAPSPLPSMDNADSLLGTVDHVTQKLILSPKQTLPSARAFVERMFFQNEVRTIHHWNGNFYVWIQCRYRLLDDIELTKALIYFLDDALRPVSTRSGGIKLKPFQANPNTAKAVLETLRAIINLDRQNEPPFWLNDGPTFAPRDILSCNNGHVHVPSDTVIPQTPEYFNLHAIETHYTTNSDDPLCWLAFLHQILHGDANDILLLQQWFGYCLTADTSQQKMLYLVGPKRSGKGTIARILERLLGEENFCCPTMAGLATNFGLQPLVGKLVAIVSDARFSIKDAGVVVERMLNISGEDSIVVDRKYQAPLTCRLPTRFMFLSNELPRLPEASGALTGRFVILKLTRSFYGQEDLGLEQRLAAELPGILRWAIEGWRSLHVHGRFVRSACDRECRELMEDLSSPVASFIRQKCRVGLEYRIRVEHLFDAWRRFCHEEGVVHIMTKAQLGRDLFAAFPQVAKRRGTDGQYFYAGLELITPPHDTDF